MGLRFVIDAQLPPSLARFLKSHKYKAEHVSDIWENSASDLEIWHWAVEANAVIVTKDDDFRFLSTTGIGARVVLVGFGNSRKHVLLARFAHALPAIVAALESGERLIEVR